MHLCKSLLGLGLCLCLGGVLIFPLRSYSDSPPTLPDDYSDNSETVGTLSIGSFITGAIEQVSDVDWIKIVLDTTKTYKVTLNSETLVMVSFSILKADRLGRMHTQMSDNTEKPSDEIVIYFTPLVNSDYFLEVSAATKSTGTYRVSIEVDDAVDATTQSRASSRPAYPMPTETQKPLKTLQPIDPERAILDTPADKNIWAYIHPLENRASLIDPKQGESEVDLDNAEWVYIPTRITTRDIYIPEYSSSSYAKNLGDSRHHSPPQSTLATFSAAQYNQRNTLNSNTSAGAQHYGRRYEARQEVPRQPQAPAQTTQTAQVGHRK